MIIKSKSLLIISIIYLIFFLGANFIFPINNDKITAKTTSTVLSIILSSVLMLIAIISAVFAFKHAKTTARLKVFWVISAFLLPFPFALALAFLGDISPDGLAFRKKFSYYFFCPICSTESKGYYILLVILAVLTMGLSLLLPGNCKNCGNGLVVWPARKKAALIWLLIFFIIIPICIGLGVLLFSS